jgi:hypothetical protein
VFPMGLDSGENLVELTCDNNNGILYGLHWGYGLRTGIMDIKPGTVSYYPNPFTNTINFYLPQAYRSSSIAIYDASGRMVRKEERTDAIEITMGRGNMAGGCYFFEVTGDGQKIAKGTVVLR